MKITRLRIQNFRCYDDATFELDRPLLLITGRNDSGKSALLTAIEMFIDSYSKPKEADFRSLDPEEEDSSDEIRIIADVEGARGKRKIRRRFWQEDGDLQWVYELEEEVPKDDDLREALSEFKDWKADPQREFLGALGFEEFGSNQDKRYQQLKDYIDDAPSVMDWVKEKNPDLPDVNRYMSEEMEDPVKDVQKFLKDAVEDRVQEVKQEGGEYAQIEREIEKTGNEELGVLEDVFSRYDYDEDDTRLEADLDFDLLKGLSINALNVRQDGNDMPISQMGAARRRKLLLALQEWRLESLRSSEEPASLLLLYDEPDTHFDYEAQRKLFDILHALSEADGDVQLIVASHSLNLIDSVDIDGIVYLDRDTDDNDVIRTQIERLGEWSEIHGIARKLGLRNHIVLNACILCAEGKTEQRLIPELYRLDRGRSLPSIGVEMVEGPEGGADPAWRLCREVLRNSRDAFLILDSDARESDTANTIDADAISDFNDQFEEEVITSDENLVYLGEKEIEDTFEDRTLAEAFRRYIKQDIGGSIGDEEDITEVITEARNHTDGLCGGLQKEVHERTNEPTRLSKPAFCEHLIDLIQEDPDTHPIPDEITQAFDLLDDYVDPEK
jgi:predicted ATP-dependent endonuclease of OLD family